MALVNNWQASRWSRNLFPVVNKRTRKKDSEIKIYLIYTALLQISVLHWAHNVPSFRSEDIVLSSASVGHHSLLLANWDSRMSRKGRYTWVHVLPVDNIHAAPHDHETVSNRDEILIRNRSLRLKLNTDFKRRDSRYSGKYAHTTYHISLLQHF